MTPESLWRFRKVLVPFLFLVMSALACGGDIDLPEVTVPAAVETAQQLARQAAQSASDRAGNVAGTAVALATAEGSDALATVKAVATPHVNFLKERLNNIITDENGVYRVTLTDEELNTFNRLRQLVTGDVIGAAVQSQEISFSGGNIELTGSVFEPLPGQLQVLFRPDVEDGQLELDLIDASFTGNELPQEALNSAETTLNNTLKELLTFVPDNIRLQEITITEGALTIIGQRLESEEE